MGTNTYRGPTTARSKESAKAEWTECSNDHKLNWPCQAAALIPRIAFCPILVLCLSSTSGRISKGVKWSQTKPRVCTQLPGAALRIAGSRQNFRSTSPVQQLLRDQEDLCECLRATGLQSASAFDCYWESYSDVCSSHDLSTHSLNLQTSGTRSSRHFRASSIC